MNEGWSQESGCIVGKFLSAGRKVQKPTPVSSGENAGVSRADWPLRRPQGRSKQWDRDVTVWKSKTFSPKGPPGSGETCLFVPFRGI